MISVSLREVTSRVMHALLPMDVHMLTIIIVTSLIWAFVQIITQPSTSYHYNYIVGYMHGQSITIIGR